MENRLKIVAEDTILVFFKSGTFGRLFLFFSHFICFFLVDFKVLLQVAKPEPWRWYGVGFAKGPKMVRFSRNTKQNL